MSLSPKQLTIKEMWNLYRLLKDHTPSPLKEKAVDNILPMYKKSSPQIIMSSIRIMFDGVEEFKPGEILRTFGAGIKNCGYFDFVNFARNL